MSKFIIIYCFVESQIEKTEKILKQGNKLNYIIIFIVLKEKENSVSKWDFILNIWIILVYYKITKIKKWNLQVT